MADITYCTGKDCPIKMNCKRYQLKSADPWQAWTDPPFDMETNSCELFLYKPTKDKEENRIHGTLGSPGGAA